MRFSICIPTYEMHGRGVLYLDYLFRTLRKQKYTNFEIVISDHSVDNLIADYCESMSKQFVIQYLPFSEKRGNSSANINNAIKSARGEIIKLMHQDDFFYDSRCLSYIDKIYQKNSNVFWGACGYIHTDADASKYYFKQTPRYSEYMAYAENTIGAPSVLFYHNGTQPYIFDENFIWMNDCEFYFRLFREFGSPTILNKTLIAIRKWPEQVTNNQATENLRNREKEYMLKKYNLPPLTVTMPPAL